MTEKDGEDVWVEGGGCCCCKHFSRHNKGKECTYRIGKLFLKMQILSVYIPWSSADTSLDMKLLMLGGIIASTPDTTATGRRKNISL